MHQWNDRAWRSWRKDQHWNRARSGHWFAARRPPSKHRCRPPATKLSASKADLLSDSGTATEPPPTAPKQAAKAPPKHRTMEEVEQKKRKATKLKTIVALRRTLTEEQDSSLADALDKEILDIRSSLRADLPPQQAEEEAIEILAKAKTALDNAAAQVTKACDHRDSAETEVKRCEDVLEEIQEQKAASRKAGERMATSVRSMADLLGGMRSKAKWTQNSEAVLPPIMLEQLATLVAR